MMDTEKSNMNGKDSFKATSEASIPVDIAVGSQNTNMTTAASYIGLVPGPSPSYRFKKLPTFAAHYGTIACGCVIFLLSGYNLALMGSVSSNELYKTIVGLSNNDSQSQLLIGVINAMYWVGVMTGALMVGWFADRVGRRKAIVCAGLFGIVVIPVFASLQNFGWALSLRLLNGLATGAFDSCCLTWSAETASHKHRGLAIGLELCCAATGASIAYFIGYGLTKTATGDVVWRFPLAFQIIFVLIILAVVSFLPESPRWLIKVGMIPEAKEVLQSLQSNISEEDGSSIIEHEIMTIRLALEEEMEQHASTNYISMLFSRDRFKTARRSWSALFIQFACQALVGVGFVSGYGISIFETGGWSADLASLLAGFSIVTQAVFGLLGAYFIADKIGRRPAMIYGSFIGAIIIAMIGMCGHFVSKYVDTNPGLTRSYSVATVALQMIWSAQFGLTWLWCPFTYPSEIFPARSRAMGSSFGVVGFALGSFFCSMVSTYMFAAIGYKALFLICGLSILVSIICFFFMPETAGKTLEDIDHLFD